MFSTVTATAPTRVDLAGGTLDLWPIHNLLEQKATVNLAISLNATTKIYPSKNRFYNIISRDTETSDSGKFADIIHSKRLPLIGLLISAFWAEELPPITVETSALSPAGAGLGGSSCLAITVLKALWTARRRIDPSLPELTEERLVRTAQDVESLVILAPTGVQDYWGAVRGGINILKYPFGETTVETLPGHIWNDQEFKLLCCYSGKSRASAINNWEIFKGLFNGDKQLLARMQAIGALAQECADAILAGEWKSAFVASQKEWILRTQLWPTIETSETKSIDHAAVRAGALFTRVCGAGGGGVMAILSPIDRVEAVSSAMTIAGGKILDVIVGGSGLELCL